MRRSCRKAGHFLQDAILVRSRTPLLDAAATGRAEGTLAIVSQVQMLLEGPTCRHACATSVQESVPTESRTVLLESSRSTPGFTHNGIKTAKYNPITFLPIFLFEMFSRAAYLYFLIQVRLETFVIT